MLFFTGVHPRANTHLSRCQKFFSRTYSNRMCNKVHILRPLNSKYRILISYHFSMYFYLFNVYISADPLECPSGTLAYGMTLFIPESVYWRDPDLGPPPIRLTIMCHNDELSSTMSWVGCLLTDSKIFCLICRK